VPDRPEVFHLDRLVDVSGISGTGCVAWGVRWPDGTVSIRWCSEDPSFVNWERGMESVERIHGHGGSTRIVWEGQQ
jgi:hypothetical protein